MRTDKVNLAEKLARIHEHWRPKVVGALNVVDEILTAPGGERI